MIFDKRSLILFASNILLLHVMLLVNSTITFWAFNFFILGPIFIIAPLYLRADQFFITSILTGFWVDAALPTHFGLITILLLIIGSIILLVRLRFRAEKNFHPCLLAHVANLITGATLFYFSASTNLSDFFSLFSTNFIELIASHIALLFVAPWFFNFQRSLFSIFKTKTDPESLPFV